jgi:hypothetical protein
MRSYQEKLKRVLDVMGGLYLLEDILTAIREGKMQGFVVNNSWAITEALEFPRARKLNILAVVGDMADIDKLQTEIIDYADRNNFSLISAVGRRGWMPAAKERGWKLKAKSYLYHKEL